MRYLRLGCGFPRFRGCTLPHPEADPTSPSTHLPQAPGIHSLREMILGNLPFILDNEPGILGMGRTALLWKRQENIRKSPIPKEHPNCPCSQAVDNIQQADPEFLGALGMRCFPRDQGIKVGVICIDSRASSSVSHARICGAQIPPLNVTVPHSHFHQ